jgi:hypothetical protein
MHTVRVWRPKKNGRFRWKDMKQLGQFYLHNQRIHYFFTNYFAFFANLCFVRSAARMFFAWKDRHRKAKSDGWKLKTPTKERTEMEIWKIWGNVCVKHLPLLALTFNRPTFQRWSTLGFLFRSLISGCIPQLGNFGEGLREPDEHFIITVRYQTSVALTSSLRCFEFRTVLRILFGALNKKLQSWLTTLCMTSGMCFVVVKLAGNIGLFQVILGFVRWNVKVLWSFLQLLCIFWATFVRLLCSF